MRDAGFEQYELLLDLFHAALNATVVTPSLHAALLRCEHYFKSPEGTEIAHAWVVHKHGLSVIQKA